MNIHCILKFDNKYTLLSGNAFHISNILNKAETDPFMYKQYILDLLSSESWVDNYGPLVVEAAKRDERLIDCGYGKASGGIWNVELPSIY